MTTASNSPVATITPVLFIVLLLLTLHPTDAQIGVCYGRNGDNLPSEQDVVNLYKSNGIKAMRLYDPDQAALQALQGAGINIILDVPKDTLQSLGSDPSAAMQWVQTNVVPYASFIRYIAVGNEVHPADAEASQVLPAMQNVLNALNAVNAGGQIKVSTAIDTSLITNAFPPSDGVFSDASYITPIINFLTSNGSPLLVNIYPYFAYTGNEQSINLNYALFTAPGTVVTDSNNQLQYQNLFDALVDAVYAALARAGAPNTAIVVSESGWPSEGGDAASVDNAGTYYKNLIGHVNQGTPLKSQAIETYLFAMFDEDKKMGAATEQHFGLFTHYFVESDAEAQIGACYGRNGNNLPSEQDVINLFKSSGIARMRLYDPNQNALQALRGSNIGLILDVPRTSLISIGSDASAANRWVQANVVPYASNVNFRYITVGNEIQPTDSEARSVLPAMQNIQSALQSANLGGTIKVSTAIDSGFIDNTFPPSNGVFSNQNYMNPIINFLRTNGSPLLANIYPYFSFTGSSGISLNYALFTAPGTVVTDPNNGLQYQNLFDALVDAVYAALARAGAPQMQIVVSESGWPSAGGNAATIDNAGTYYKNLISHVKQGTPMKRGQAIETYLFAMFDENLKSAGVEQHFGIFTPNKQPKYQLNFS